MAEVTKKKTTEVVLPEASDETNEKSKVTKLTTLQKVYLNSKNISAQLEIPLSELFPNQIKGRDDLVHLPNDYARCSLFTVRGRREPRKSMVREKLFHLNSEVSVLYTGTELRAESDELVWLKIMSYGKNTVPGEPFEFYIKDIVRDMNLTKTGKNYERVGDCLARLRGAVITLQSSAAYGVSCNPTLISNFISINDEFGLVNKFRVWIDPTIILLFAGSTFTSHEWEIYRDLSPVARRLADYMGSHKKPFPITLEKFREICGSTSKSKSSWHTIVSKASIELVKNEVAAKITVQAGRITIIRSLNTKQSLPGGPAPLKIL